MVASSFNKVHLSLPCLLLGPQQIKHPDQMCICKIKKKHHLTLCTAKLSSFFSSAFLTYSKASYVSCFFRSASMSGWRVRSRAARANLHRNSASSLHGHTHTHTAQVWPYTGLTLHRSENQYSVHTHTHTRQCKSNTHQKGIWILWKTVTIITKQLLLVFGCSVFMER